MSLYPAFLKLDGLSVVVVGGGPVAAGKLLGLLEAGAKVTVVAPVICDAIRKHDDVVTVFRAFHPRDLDGARWVVAAAPPQVNKLVVAAAEARGLFVNAVDDTANATAYLGGVVRRGDVTLAISTNGRAPGLAGLLREALDAILPADVQDWVEVAAAERAEHKRDGIAHDKRRPLLLRALDKIYLARSA